MDYVNVIGGGLAGSEAALFLANNGVKVKLYDMKPKKFSDAHKYHGFCELVCSNSLKSDRLDTSSGLLKAEMKHLKSKTLVAAEVSKVPAGGALAVDRVEFSNIVTSMIKNHDNIEVVSEEVISLNLDEFNIVCTGPLTSESLSKFISELISEEYLSFFDAASPIISLESINLDVAFFASRYNKGEADYLNCALNKEEYDLFYNELINADIAEIKSFEKKFFKVYEGCMPVEVMAKRGYDTLRFGPLKPVGIKNPKSNQKPFAVVQLRAENKDKTMYNLVGFQTNLKFSEQKRVFSKIPGLENCEILRYGVMHRNTFINSPKVLNKDLSLKGYDKTFFAGQMTGVEGYMESAAIGLVAAFNLLNKLRDEPAFVFPNYTMIGALLSYITDESLVDFQPMASNMGLLPSLKEKIKDKKQRYEKLCDRSLSFYNNLDLRI